jgi:hypothetical protein
MRGFVIRANEDVRPGCYVEIWQGDVSTVFYCPKVDFDYQPYIGMFQVLTLERGDGFIQSTKATARADRYYGEVIKN